MHHYIIALFESKQNISINAVIHLVTWHRSNTVYRCMCAMCISNAKIKWILFTINLSTVIELKAIQSNCLALSLNEWTKKSISPNFHGFFPSRLSFLLNVSNMWQIHRIFSPICFLFTIFFFLENIIKSERKLIIWHRKQLRATIYFDIIISLNFHLVCSIDIYGMIRFDANNRNWIPSINYTI